MKHQRLNNATFLFALVFAFITVLLPEKEAPLLFFNHHTQTFFAKQDGSRFRTLAFERGESSQKIERKKLRVRYTGSEITFQFTETINPLLSISHLGGNFSLHTTRRASLHLRHVAALRAPPTV